VYVPKMKYFFCVQRILVTLTIRKGAGRRVDWMEGRKINQSKERLEKP